MTEHNPIAINLHKKSRLLEISFDTGENYMLSCEYLRTHGKSAEIKSVNEPVAGKINVNIDSIEAQGSYALRLFFDDGYDQGIYSWETLYELGENYEKNWANYLATLEKYHLNRGEADKTHNGPAIIKILYFMDKLIAFTKEEEELELPEKVKTIEDLLAFLSKRGMRWERAFKNDSVQFTVNKEFAELFTVLEHGDEIALIPKAQ
ncbi:gamma-butyrobetaine hydroxylase-like domain-containing protein [sulfur-oxidizing endosymbiont of Gigantopelta aegis]|uniref:gamma-butyrobetaine hydroxylase-like domain-containing protein n=1 Tax=sulfur-oxidizing endosymbiont of Gigantopelta aegis TaxID=2794934 RepID=UPI0018DCC6BE|nr:gamma-butyrobetaine hydroxylase-like domain-containing protein [sulfur-oxidizing endosymbiont of Gigantopelta aegis]